jgi:hypothetical protein
MNKVSKYMKTYGQWLHNEWKFRKKTCTMNEILRKRAKWVKGWELKLHHGQNSKKRVEKWMKSWLYFS